MPSRSDHVSPQQQGRAEDIGKPRLDAQRSAAAGRVIILCSLTTFMDGYDVQALGLALPGISKDFGVAPTAFTGALSGSLIGMALGAMLLAPLADRVGRRPMLVASMLLIGATTLGALLSPTIGLFTAFRVATGLGLGAAVPVAVALTADYATPRHRAALITAMVACMALGAFTAGMAAPWLESGWGWQGIFGVGAALPIAMAVLLWLLLPQSLGLGGKVLTADVATSVARGEDATYDTRNASSRSSVRAILADEYRFRTLLLWTIFWFNLFAAYSLISWLPTLLLSVGWGSDDAQRATGLLSLGGIAGGLVLAWLGDRGLTIRAMITAYVGAAALLCALAVVQESVLLWTILLALAGAGIFGGQMALASIAAASFYPRELCATGVGWYNGMARIGAIIGPLALSVLISAGWHGSSILGILAVPMLICAAGVLLLPRALRSSV